MTIDDYKKYVVDGVLTKKHCVFNGINNDSTKVRSLSAMHLGKMPPDAISSVVVYCILLYFDLITGNDTLIVLQ